MLIPMLRGCLVDMHQVEETYLGALLVKRHYSTEDDLAVSIRVDEFIGLDPISNYESEPSALEEVFCI
jgi:hypothetical protein